jgi:kynurenine formamidase
VGDAPSRRTLNTIAANGFYSQEWTFGEHSGTHMDAPGHFGSVQESRSGRQIPLSRLGRRRRPVAARAAHITGIGVDRMSLDPGMSASFDAHKTLLAADRYGLENIATLRDIPARGAQVTVGVIPWEEGSGGPCRLRRPTSTS